MLTYFPGLATTGKAALCLAALALFPLSAPAAEKAAGSTLENLVAAFNGESNAHARYVAFAVKADEEGYKGVGSLFRAAARAEEIHAANHKKVIEELGGAAVADIATPDVKSTAENLAASIEGESYERDTMYPEFIAQARKEGNKAALRTFNYAKTAEAEHATFYKSALDALDSWKEAKPFYVCTVCGYTTNTMDFAKCLSCFKSKEKYVTVS